MGTPTNTQKHKTYHICYFDIKMYLFMLSCKTLL